MKIYSCVLDGDNFIGIAVCESVEEAYKLTKRNCWSGNEDNLSFFEINLTKIHGRDLKDIEERYFLRQEYIGDEIAKFLGYKDVNHICLGIKGE